MRFHWHAGNTANLLINGEEFFPRVFERIRQARKEILLETFIIFADVVGLELKEALLEAAARGVRIAVTVDGYGTANLDKAYVAELTEAGVLMQMFDPRPRFMGMRTNLFRRLHRKIVVVDGEIAFIGGINFGADHLVETGNAMCKQDYALEVRGPIVADLHRAARATLRHTPTLEELPHVEPVTKMVGHAQMLLALRDNDKHNSDIEEQYIRAFRSARHRILLANAYFFPSYRILRELRNAARRGVTVILILQGRPDMTWVSLFSSLLYNYLLKNNVSIAEYREHPLHAKVAVVDDEWLTVGSSNLDPLSMSLNLEANLIIRDPALNQKLYDHLFELSCKHCQNVTPKIAARGRWWRAPLIFLSFHFLRHFPAIVGWFPAHTPKVEPLLPGDDTSDASIPADIQPDEDLPAGLQSEQPTPYSQEKS